MRTINPGQSTAYYGSIKLGIDAHAQYCWVSRQVDGTTQQPVQKMTDEKLRKHTAAYLFGRLLLCGLRDCGPRDRQSDKIFLLAPFPQRARYRRGAR
jgi:hypothetical protein